MPVKEELRSLDTFSIAHIHNRRKSLNDIVGTVEAGRLIGEAVEALVPGLTPEYAKRLGVTPVIIEQSLYNLLGHKSGGFPTLLDCKKANWILAANVDVMKAGRPVVMFDKAHWPEWVPMLLQAVNKDFNFEGKPGFWYKFMAVGGTPATELFSRFVMNKGGWWFAHTIMFGLSKRSYRLLESPRVYVGMYTWAYLDPACKFAPFDRTEVTPSFESHNRELLAKRNEPCIYNKPYTCPKCPVSREDCVRSLHSATYIPRHCASCHAQGWFLESEATETSCIECRDHARVARKAMALKGRNKHANAS